MQDMFFMVLISRTLFLAALVLTADPTSVVQAQVQCWVAPQKEGPVSDARWARHLKAMSAAETIVKQSQEFLHPPVPVRMRITMKTNRFGPMDSRLIVEAYPEQTPVGIGIWRGACGITSDADRMAGSMGRISVFFNHLSKDMVMNQDEVPTQTGARDGYPEYNGWVVISKNGRLPWIPQTLGDRLDHVRKTRERALAGWRDARISRRAPDQATTDRIAALRRPMDPTGADQYVGNMKQLSADFHAAQTMDTARDALLAKLLTEYRAYRASFTAQQLAMPAVWADPDGSARKAMETRIEALSDPGPEDQQRAGELREESRRLEREAAASDNDATARRLRAQAVELWQDADLVAKHHMERVAMEEEALRGAYELTNLKPGSAEQAVAYKMDPTFPNRSQPGKIQLIAVSVFSPLAEDELRGPEHAARQAWLERVKASINYAALAALLD